MTGWARDAEFLTQRWRTKTRIWNAVSDKYTFIAVYIIEYIDSGKYNQKLRFDFKIYYLFTKFSIVLSKSKFVQIAKIFFFANKPLVMGDISKKFLSSPN